MCLWCPQMAVFIVNSRDHHSYAALTPMAAKSPYFPFFCAATNARFEEGLCLQL